MTVLNSLHNAVSWSAEKTDAIPVIGTVVGWGSDVTDYVADLKNGRPTSVKHLMSEGVDTLHKTFEYVPIVNWVTGGIKGVKDVVKTASHSGQFFQNLMNGVAEGGKDLFGKLLDFLGNNKGGLIGAAIAATAGIALTGGLGGTLIGVGALVAGSFLFDGDKGLAKSTVSKLTSGNEAAKKEADQRAQNLEQRKETAQTTVSKSKEKDKALAVNAPSVPANKANLTLMHS